jgi:hypothetical protein
VSSGPSERGRDRLNTPLSNSWRDRQQGTGTTELAWSQPQWPPSDADSGRHRAETSHPWESVDTYRNVQERAPDNQHFRQQHQQQQQQSPPEQRARSYQQVHPEDVSDDDDDADSMSDSLEFDGRKSHRLEGGGARAKSSEQLRPHSDTTQWHQLHPTVDDGSESDSERSGEEEEEVRRQTGSVGGQHSDKKYNWAQDVEEDVEEEEEEGDDVAFSRRSSEDHHLQSHFDAANYYNQYGGEPDLEAVARQSFLPDHDSASEGEDGEGEDRLKQVNSSLLQSLQAEHGIRLQLEEKIKHLEVRQCFHCVHLIIIDN